MYEIATHFSEAARRAAAQEQYPDVRPAELDKHPGPRSLDGYCPLGVALRADKKPAARVPGPGSVVWALTQRRGDQWLLTDFDLQDQARAFIDDWDDGKITDLAEALGVEP